MNHSMAAVHATFVLVLHGGRADAGAQHDGLSDFYGDFIALPLGCMGGFFGAGL
jgi:hypothetical protein